MDTGPKLSLLAHAVQRYLFFMVIATKNLRASSASTYPDLACRCGDSPVTENFLALLVRLPYDGPARAHYRRIVDDVGAIA